MLVYTIRDTPARGAAGCRVHLPAARALPPPPAAGRHSVMPGNPYFPGPDRGHPSIQSTKTVWKCTVLYGSANKCSAGVLCPGKQRTDVLSFGDTEFGIEDKGLLPVLAGLAQAVS